MRKGKRDVQAVDPFGYDSHELENPVPLIRLNPVVKQQHQYNEDSKRPIQHSTKPKSKSSDIIEAFKKTSISRIDTPDLAPDPEPKTILNAPKKAPLARPTLREQQSLPVDKVLSDKKKSNKRSTTPKKTEKTTTPLRPTGSAPRRLSNENTPIVADVMFDSEVFKVNSMSSESNTKCKKSVHKPHPRFSNFEEPSFQHRPAKGPSVSFDVSEGSSIQLNDGFKKPHSQSLNFQRTASGRSKKGSRKRRAEQLASQKRVVSQPKPDFNQAKIDHFLNKTFEAIRDTSTNVPSHTPIQLALYAFSDKDIEAELAHLQRIVPQMKLEVSKRSDYKKDTAHIAKDRLNGLVEKDEAAERRRRIQKHKNKRTNILKTLEKSIYSGNLL